MFCHFFQFWSGLIEATLSPVCRALGLIFSRGGQGLVQSA